MRWQVDVKDNRSNIFVTIDKMDLILGFVLNWVFTPESAAADYGFVLKDLNDNAQNALIRDFTSFFISTFIFTILGVITLNPTWFLAAGIIYYGAAVFNLYAIFIHGTNYNQIYIGEIILGSWPTIIAFAILYFKKNE